MGSFRQFCQQEPLQEGLLSRVTSFFKKPKKTKERPTDVETSKTRSYRTYNDIDPADVPTFKPSFSVKKEEELEEGRSRKKIPGERFKEYAGLNRKMRKANKTSSNKTSLDPKYKSYQDRHSERHNKRYEPKGKSYLLKGKLSMNEDCGVEKQANGKANQKPTKDKNDKKEFFMKFSQFRRKEIKEGRYQGKFNIYEPGIIGVHDSVVNRKVRKAEKAAFKAGAYKTDDYRNHPSMAKIKYYQKKSNYRYDNPKD